MQKSINGPLEKCLDCMNFGTGMRKYLVVGSRGAYRCHFGQMPALVQVQAPTKEIPHPPLCYVCAAYMPPKEGEEAPAMRELLRRRGN